MTAPPERAHLRVVEDPLGPAVLDLPGAQWDEMIRKSFAQPIPDYSGETLRRFLALRYRG